MKYLSDAAIDAALAGSDLRGRLRRAFADFAVGKAAMQPRMRTACERVMLSTLGAVWPEQGVAGAKVYTTIDGQFNFLIVLFSTRTGAVLAALDANAITRWRTAAVSVIAAECFARRDAATLAIFGTGVQAHAHLRAFAQAFSLSSIRIVSRGTAADLAAEARKFAQDVRVTNARDAVEGAELVVTATRATEPLFDGSWLGSGAFVAAVGSSKPATRETDDALIARAAAIVVEWREQTLQEAGDLVRADPTLLSRVPIIDLGEALARRDVPRRPEGDVILFKSVGVGLADVAAAAVAYERAAANRVIEATGLR